LLTSGASAKPRCEQHDALAELALDLEATDARRHRAAEAARDRCCRAAGTVSSSGEDIRAL